MTTIRYIYWKLSHFKYLITNEGWKTGGVVMISINSSPIHSSLDLDLPLLCTTSPQVTTLLRTSEGKESSPSPPS